MMDSAQQRLWSEVNQEYLTAAIRELGAMLEDRLASADNGDSKTAELEKAQQALKATAERMPAPSAVEILCQRFDLSPFERKILLLCAGVELESHLADLCVKAHGDSQRPCPTFGLALATFPDAHWSALCPDRPLRRWRLVEVGSADRLVASPLRIDERILHYLTGVQHLDERLTGFVDPLAPLQTSDLVDSHRQLALQVAALWSEGNEPTLPVLHLWGCDGSARRDILRTASQLASLPMFAISLQILPTVSTELMEFLRLWEREAALTGAGLLLEGEGPPQIDSAGDIAARRLLEYCKGVIVLSTPARWTVPSRPLVSLEVMPPAQDEQRSVWLSTLAGESEDTVGLSRILSHFRLGPRTIRTVHDRARHLIRAARSKPDSATGLGELLWESCKVEARPNLGSLAQRLEVKATWKDIALTPRQLSTLREIGLHVRESTRVYHDWGFASKLPRGLGITALFAGPSGVGKTFAAEVLANELDLDLFRIDLSQVVSKYIGETEKKLQQVFDSAEAGGSILLFDEADALFGKRTVVRDSHDRFANIEISYLLQRMETYRGLAILTTNMKKAMDEAFLRRLRFSVQFSFPDAAMRERIWRLVFPPDTPTEGLDYPKLARLGVTGGNIRNIALHAAFWAADEGGPVTMAHLLRGAQQEFAKLERPLLESEVSGWV